MALIKKICYFVAFDEFVDFVKSLFTDNEDFDVEFDGCEGIYFCGVTNDDVYQRVGDYIGKEVSSIHTDHFDYTGVYIVCK